MRLKVLVPISIMQGMKRCRWHLFFIFIIFTIWKHDLFISICFNLLLYKTVEYQRDLSWVASREKKWYHIWWASGLVHLVLYLEWNKWWSKQLWIIILSSHAMNCSLIFLASFFAYLIVFFFLHAKNRWHYFEDHAGAIWMHLLSLYTAHNEINVEKLDFKMSAKCIVNVIVLLDIYKTLSIK